MKCIFATSTEAFCISCRRRGTKCFGQELPEEISDPLHRNQHWNDRVVRVESLVEQMLDKASNDPDRMSSRTTGTYDARFSHGIATPTPAGSDPPRDLDSDLRFTVRVSSNGDSGA